MPNNTGTLIISPIRPQSSVDTFPSAYASELLGGHHQVADIAARDAIPEDRLSVGMFCTVQDTNTVYILDSTGPAVWSEFEPGSSAQFISGTEDLNTVDNVYTIGHPALSGQNSLPIVSLISPENDSEIFVTAITNIQTTGFDVVLSGVPSVTGYQLNWINGTPATTNLSGGVFVHNELVGLSADDHPQYLLVDGTREITGSLIPSTSGTLDLGSLSQPFRELYVTENSIYLGSHQLSVSNGNLQFNGVDVGADISADVAVLSGGIDANTAAIASNDTDISNLTLDVAVVSGGVDTNSAAIAAIQGDYVDLSSNQNVGGEKTFTDDVTINSNLYVNGTETIVNTTSVSAADNTITVNAGEVGAGVTAGEAGIVVDRGTATDYQIVFNETTDTFRIGETGSEQAVATREDSPIDTGVAIWNSAANRFDTSLNYVDRSTTQSISGDKTFEGITSFNEIGSSIIPSTSGTLDLGSATRPFKDLHLTENSLYFGSNTLHVVDGELLFNDEAIGTGGSSNLGVDWVTQTSAADNSWSRIVYGNGVFVAASYSGTNRIMYSSDGVNWFSANTPPDNNNWLGLAYGNGVFVAVANGGTNRVVYSYDGSNWYNSDPVDANQWRGLAYGNGIFVAVAGSGTNRVMTSVDGIVWTPRNQSVDYFWRHVEYGNGLFVAFADAGGANDRIMSSPDGINWTTRSTTQVATNAWVDAAYGNGIFLAVASSSTSAGAQIGRSVDGINWNLVAVPQINSWSAIAYGEGKFIAVASTGTNRVMSSTDGLNWDLQNQSEDNSWIGIHYHNGIFVATAASGVGNRVMTSGSLNEIEQFDYQGTEITSNGDKVITMELSGGIPTSLVPDTTGSSYDLGNSERPFRDAYLSDTLYINSDTITVSGGTLLVNGSEVQGGGSSEDTATYTAGEAVSGGDLCYQASDGLFYLADSTAEATSTGLLAIATENISLSGSGTFRLSGTQTDGTLVPGSIYYVSTAGTITSTPDTTTNGSVVRVVGYGLPNGDLRLSVDETWVTVGTDSSIEVFGAGESVTGGELCYQDTDGFFYKANASAVDTSSGMLAIALESISATSSGNFQISGIYTDGTLSPGVTYYIDSVSGQITSTPDTITEDYVVRVVGYGLPSGDLNISFDETWITVGPSVVGRYVSTFTDADLVSGVLTVTHDLGNQYVSVHIIDNNDMVVIPDDITYTDDNNLDVDLTSSGTLVGDWTVLVLAKGGGGGTQISADGTNLDTLELNGGIPTSLVPDTSGTLSLGTSGAPWKELFVTQNSVYLGSNKLSVAGSNLQLNDANVGAVEAASVGQAELKTSQGIVSTTNTLGENLTMAGGQYGFYPQVGDSTDGDPSVSAQIASVRSNNESQRTNIFLVRENDDIGTTRAWQRYITASPPYDLGDGQVPLFVFIRMVDGKISSTYIAEAPPWAYNGPTTIRPDEYKYDENGILNNKFIHTTQYKLAVENYQRKQALGLEIPTDEDVLLFSSSKKQELASQKVTVNVDMERKNKDMDIIPHPFYASDSDVILLLDPCETQELLNDHEAGLDVSKLIHDQYIELDNETINRCVPNGVTPCKFRWKNSNGN